MDGYLLAGIGVGIPAVVSYLFYTRRRDYCKVLEDIKVYAIDDSLTDLVKQSQSNCLSYAAVSGYVKANGNPIISSEDQNKIPNRGVIHNINIIEHKSEWSKSSNSWNDVARIVDTTKSCVPFSLENKDGDNQVSVNDPLLAEGLTYNRIHQKFEPTSTSFSDSLFSLASGEKVKGYETNEEMLLEGTRITGLGKITFSEGKITLCKPEGPLKYILSTASLQSIISSQTYSAKLMKSISIFFAIGSTLFLAYWLYRNLKKWYISRLNRLEFKKLLEDNKPSTEDENGCLICLKQPRDVVILDCGHICICHECSKKLTTCPICRSPIERVVPTFTTT